MSIRPWQKSTLSVMAGAAIYAVAMQSLVSQEQRHNQAVAKQQEEVRAQQAALEAAFQTKKQELIDLEKKLYQTKANVAAVNSEIKAVRKQLQLVKAGYSAGLVRNTSSTSQNSTGPNLASLSSIQPPPVQGVTRASAP